MTCSYHFFVVVTVIVVLDIVVEIVVVVVDVAVVIIVIVVVDVAVVIIVIVADVVVVVVCLFVFLVVIRKNRSFHAVLDSIHLMQRTLKVGAKKNKNAAVIFFVKPLACPGSTGRSKSRPRYR